MIVHESILTETQLRVLRAIGPFARRAGFYLAGDTAVALRFGHRRSEDFDWFAPSLQRPAALLSNLQAEDLPIRDAQVEAGTLIGRIEGVKVSFFEYGYPLLDSLDEWSEYGTDIASPRDLGAMKLLAVAQRGSRKDFVDVHELLENGAVLGRMLEDFRGKFKSDPVSALRGLTYFDDAETEPMPEMMLERDWPSIRARILNRVSQYFKSAGDV